ncbi:DUF6817 domain-containing protein [Spirillospora sp. CA-294931]|uniref:DUF6817 domain-containing protein n=1 Tax=Spirillospora sp. CA-294931 TaxID=3240042 RepID=UPI003D8B81AA
MVSEALSLLESRGAASLPHPGGTLLVHLSRVHTTLVAWGARDDLCLAGLCHAFYGTDGFAAALGEHTDRDVLASVIGPAAEEIVYLYGACARAETYPSLTTRPVLADRFTGVRVPLSDAVTRDFAELTVANELDVMAHSAAVREEHGAALLALFRSWNDLLSPSAREAAAAFPTGP